MIDYSKILSERTVKLQPSGIRKFFEILDEVKGVISLTVGQPDFVTPWHIRDAGIRSLQEGLTYYTSNNGMMEFRKEISAYQKRRFGLEYDPVNEIIVTVGGSEAIDLAMRTIIEPGDEVIIPEPCFVCYEPLARRAGGVPVAVKLVSENSFRLTAEQLKSAITEKTKLLVLPFPNNPPGAIMDRKDLEDIAKVVIEKDLFVISDEINEELGVSDNAVMYLSLELFDLALSYCVLVVFSILMLSK